MADIPNLIKHWPCAVKTHFPGQHIRHGRSNIIYIIYIYLENQLNPIDMFISCNFFFFSISNNPLRSPKKHSRPWNLDDHRAWQQRMPKNHFFSGNLPSKSVQIPKNWRVRLKCRPKQAGNYKIFKIEPSCGKLRSGCGNCARVAQYYSHKSHVRIHLAFQL